MRNKVLFEKKYEIHESGITVSKRSLNNDFDLHTHDFYEIEFIISGRAEHRINDYIYEIGQGDIYMLSPSDFHMLTIKEPLEYINIMFTEQSVSGSLLYELVASRKIAAYCLNAREYNKLMPVFTLISDEAVSKERHSNVFTKNLCECIMITLLRHLKINEKTAKMRKSIYSTVLYINRNFRSEINLDLLSEEAGLSRNYYSTIFNKAFGMSVSEYITDIRLEYAKKLIFTADVPVTTACFNAGFGSFSTFSRAYKKKYGVPPTKCKRG